MAARNTAGPAEEQHGRGWIPMVSFPGNAMLIGLDPVIAWRLRERMETDRLAPLEIASCVERALREYAEEAMPA